MSIATKIVKYTLTTGALLGLAAGIAKAAETLYMRDAAQDLASISEVEQLADADGGGYATSAMELLDTASTFGRSFTITQGSAFAVVGNKTHYVAAERTKAGQYVLMSNSHPTWEVCRSYDSDCVAKVTRSVDLIDAVPDWTSD